MASCDTLTADLFLVRDLGASITAAGELVARGPGSPAVGPGGVTPTLSVVKLKLVGSTEAAAAIRLLRAIYDQGVLANLVFGGPWAGCSFLGGFAFPLGRARAVDAIAAYLKTVNGLADPAALGNTAIVIKGILTDPRAGKDSRWDEPAVLAAAKLITSHPTASFDKAAWLPLWRWALGGPTGNASVGTRVFAMKAIQAILRRGALLPGEVRAADSLAAILRDQVAQRALFVSPAERDLFLSDAQATVGAAAQAAVALPTPGAPSDYPALPPAAAEAPWLAIGLGAGLLITAVGVTAAVIHRRRAAHAV